MLSSISAFFLVVFHPNDFDGEHFVRDFARGAQCSVNIDPIGCQWHGACLKKKGRKGGKRGQTKAKETSYHHHLLHFFLFFEKKPLFNKSKNVGGRNDRAAHLFFPAENDSNSLLHLCVDRIHVPAFGRRSSGNEATEKQNNSSLSTAKSIVDWIAIAAKFVNISASRYNDINYRGIDPSTFS
jgi:hypothetical protein